MGEVLKIQNYRKVYDPFLYYEHSNLLEYVGPKDLSKQAYELLYHIFFICVTLNKQIVYLTYDNIKDGVVVKGKIVVNGLGWSHATIKKYLDELRRRSFITKILDYKYPRKYLPYSIGYQITYKSIWSKAKKEYPSEELSDFIKIYTELKEEIKVLEELGIADDYIDE